MERVATQSCDCPANLSGEVPIKGGRTTTDYMKTSSETVGTASKEHGEEKWKTPTEHDEENSKCSTESTPSKPTENEDKYRKTSPKSTSSKPIENEEEYSKTSPKSTSSKSTENEEEYRKTSPKSTPETTTENEEKYRKTSPKSTPETTTEHKEETCTVPTKHSDPAHKSSSTGFPGRPQSGVPVKRLSIVVEQDEVSGKINGGIDWSHFCRLVDLLKWIISLLKRVWRRVWSRKPGVTPARACQPCEVDYPDWCTDTGDGHDPEDTAGDYALPDDDGLEEHESPEETTKEGHPCENMDHSLAPFLDTQHSSVAMCGGQLQNTAVQSDLPAGGSQPAEGSFDSAANIICDTEAEDQAHKPARRFRNESHKSVPEQNGDSVYGEETEQKCHTGANEPEETMNLAPYKEQATPNIDSAKEDGGPVGALREANFMASRDAVEHEEVDEVQAQYQYDSDNEDAVATGGGITSPNAIENKDVAPTEPQPQLTNRNSPLDRHGQHQLLGKVDGTDVAAQSTEKRDEGRDAGDRRGHRDVEGRSERLGLTNIHGTAAKQTRESAVQTEDTTPTLGAATSDTVGMKNGDPVKNPVNETFDPGSETTTGETNANGPSACDDRMPGLHDVTCIAEQQAGGTPSYTPSREDTSDQAAETTTQSSSLATKTTSNARSACNIATEISSNRTALYGIDHQAHPSAPTGEHRRRDRGHLQQDPVEPTGREQPGPPSVVNKHAPGEQTEPTSVHRNNAEHLDRDPGEPPTAVDLDPGVGQWELDHQFIGAFPNERNQDLNPYDQNQEQAPSEHGQEQALIEHDHEQTLIEDDQEQALIEHDQEQALIEHDQEQALIEHDQEQALIEHDHEHPPSTHPVPNDNAGADAAYPGGSAERTIAQAIRLRRLKSGCDRVWAVEGAGVAAGWPVTHGGGLVVDLLQGSYVDQHSERDAPRASGLLREIRSVDMLPSHRPGDPVIIEQGSQDEAAGRREDLSMLEVLISRFRSQVQGMDQLCIRCRTNHINTVFLNCHCMVYCDDCARYIPQLSCCPSCDAPLVCYITLA